MNVIQKTLILGVTFVLIFSCKKPPEEPQPDELIGDKAILVGTWNWTYTHHRYNWCVGSELNDTIEAGEDNYSFIMKKEGRVEFYKDGDLVDSHDIFFKHFTPFEDGAFTFSIYLDGVENDRFSGIVYDNDSLMSITYPYLHSEEGCEEYRNYFTKE